jgi:hypothetical protein
MPVFLDDLSTVESYGIILLQQACGVPGVIFGTLLVETRLGRKLTVVFSFVLAGLCAFLFYISSHPASVFYI